MQVKAFLDFDEIGNGLYVVVFDKDEKAASDLIPFQCASLKDGSDNKTRKGLRIQNLARFAISAAICCYINYTRWSIRVGTELFVCGDHSLELYRVTPNFKSAHFTVISVMWWWHSMFTRSRYGSTELGVQVERLIFILQKSINFMYTNNYPRKMYSTQI